MVLVVDRGRVKGRKIVDAGVGILNNGQVADLDQAFVGRFCRQV
jgi:predicted flavoprotein YhiN